MSIDGRIRYLERRQEAVAVCAMQDQIRRLDTADYWTARYMEVTCDLLDTLALARDLAALDPTHRRAGGPSPLDNVSAAVGGSCTSPTH